MEISLKIDCTPTEARQMVGLPDLLPLYECAALALEDGLVCLVATLDPRSLGAGVAAADARRDAPHRPRRKR